VRETEGKRERRQGCQRLDRIVHRGKTTPTLVPTPATEEVRDAPKVETRVRWRSAEAAKDVVIRPVPDNAAQSLRLCGASTQRKLR